MDIHPLDRKIKSQQYLEALRKKGEVERAPGRQAEGAGEAAESDRVGVSEKALFIGRVREALKNIPDVREDLVAELRRRIEADEYHVPGEEIAERAILEALAEIRIQKLR